MVGIGEKLKEARLKKNLTLTDVENITKPGEIYTSSGGRKLKILPGMYILKVFETYAKLLELDEKN